MKRDAHGGNWLRDDMGRIVAIDMESSGFLPVGYDVAQLIEDSAMLPVTAAGWSARMEEWCSYRSRMSLHLGDHISLAVYEWFALYRALWLGTAPDGSKDQRIHARNLVTWLASESQGSLAAPAASVANLLAHVDDRELSVQRMSSSQGRISRGLAFLLRHRGPSVGVPVDSDGFAPIESIAQYLGVGVDQVSKVVENPAELRFQLVDGHVRALYGHSLDVRVDAMIYAERPEVLFHGSSWDHIQGIVDLGIQPMARQKVHLSNSATDAFRVGKRHGAGVVFAVHISPHLAPVPVADGTWVSGPIPPRDLSLINPYSAFSGR